MSVVNNGSITGSSSSLSSLPSPASGGSAYNGLRLAGNNCRMSNSFNDGLDWVHNAWTKHMSPPSGFSNGVYATFVNGLISTNSEQDTGYDFDFRCGIYIPSQGKFVRGVWLTTASVDVRLLRAWGRDTAYFDVSIPPNTVYYITNRRAAADGNTAAINITGQNNANPLVITTASHEYLAGQRVRLKDILTNQTGSVTGATQANPCVITSTGHGLVTGQYVRFSGVGGMVNLNWATNGNIDYKIVVLTVNTFSLQAVGSTGAAINSTGYGAYTTGGTWTVLSQLNYNLFKTGNPTAITQANPCSVTSANHGLITGQKVRFEGIGGMTNVNFATNGNVEYTVTVVDVNTFTIGVNSTAFGAFTSGGIWSRTNNQEFTVASPTATDFTLSGTNGAAFGVYASGGVAERVYSVIASHQGRTKRQDGVLGSKNPALDFTLGVGVGYGAEFGIPVINSSGVVTSIPVAKAGQGYSGGFSVVVEYGSAGVNQVGALVPALTTASCYGNPSGGGLGSAGGLSGGTGHNPNNPPQFYPGGAGGFGTNTATYGPVCLFGQADTSVNSVLLIGDSIASGVGSVDGDGDVYGNFGVLEQAMQNKAGIMVFAVSGDGAAGWLGNSTRRKALFSYLYGLGLRVNKVVVGLGTNDFNSNANSNVLTSVQTNIGEIITQMKAIFIDAECYPWTIVPFTTGTFTTAAGQTQATIGFTASANYGVGGFVTQYNAQLIAGTGVPSAAGYVDLAGVLADPSIPSKWRSSGDFYLTVATNVAFSSDGVHPNTTAGIPYCVSNLNLDMLTSTASLRNISIPQFNFVASDKEQGKHRFRSLAEASGISLTTATPANITSITLSAGKYRLTGVGGYTLTGATISRLVGSISRISATHGRPEAVSSRNEATVTATTTTTINTPDVIVTVPAGGTMTFFLVLEATFAAGTVSGYGTINAVSIG